MLSPDAKQELENNKARNQAWQEKVERFKKAAQAKVAGALLKLVLFCSAFLVNYMCFISSG